MLVYTSPWRGLGFRFPFLFFSFQFPFLHLGYYKRSWVYGVTAFGLFAYKSFSYGYLIGNYRSGQGILLFISLHGRRCYSFVRVNRLLFLVGYG